MAVDLRTYEAQYSVNIFIIAVPAAKRLYGEDRTVLNHALTEFSREVVALRKGKYILWAIATYARIVLKIAAFQWSLWILAPVLVTLMLVRRFRQRRQGSPLMVILDAGDHHTLLALAWLAPIYFVAAVGVLCLSGSYADSRLVVPTSVFVPPLFALLVVREAMAIRWLRHGVDRYHGL